MQLRYYDKHVVCRATMCYNFSNSELEVLRQIVMDDSQWAYGETCIPSVFEKDVGNLHVSCAYSMRIYLYEYNSSSQTEELLFFYSQNCKGAKS